MIINKISDKNNVKIITKQYLEWLDMGAISSEILVLSFNSNSKKNIEKNILKLTKKNLLSEFKIHTFNGLIYNTILDNWSKLEDLLDKEDCIISPNLVGLEVSQLLFKQIIQEQVVKGYNSKKSLLQQIFRRYSLIVNNHLSPTEIKHKSEILHEAFGEDANNIINLYKSKTIDLRSFDYIRQAQIFGYIYKNTEYFKNIKYLIIEDGDEVTPLLIDFIKSISKQLKDSLILLDVNGGSRCGYLCADLEAPQKFEKIFKEKIQNYDDKVVDKTIWENVFSETKTPIKNIKNFSASKRLDMIDEVIQKIIKLLNKNVKPSDIAIITPIQDSMLKCLLQEGLNNYDLKFLSGNEKLVQNPLVKSILVMLKLVQGKPVDEYELRLVLSNSLKIPIRYCENILKTFGKTGELREYEIGSYTEKYEQLCKVVEFLRGSKYKLSKKASYIYENLIESVDEQELKKFSFFVKELQDFEKTFVNNYDEKVEDEIIVQLENTVIAENPYSVLEIKENEIIVSTPQKIIDNKVSTKYQFWLDISSSEWQKMDIGPLYNSWVFQKNWTKDEYTVEDNIKFTNEKTARFLWKLYHNAKKIIVCSSLFDTQGVENLGGIEKFVVVETEAPKEKPKQFKIIPRDDQKPVLEYKSGKMAISAVPGAGKTTILLALIVKLLKRGIKPENIYVMTYMESAARNFKERIKALYPSSSKLPNISTIHGLALRIIKENSNYERIGLNPDFEICDDIQRGRIIKFLSKNLKKEDVEDFDRAVSVLKLCGANLNYKQNSEMARIMGLKRGTVEEAKMARFLKFFYAYQRTLISQGLIDYDDILISAVRLLEQNPDVLEYYQNICEYMIEDEAQDSSFIQQKLINMLCAKHNNLIRCGDINQAITTTFTNADISGFKQFIDESQKVSMNCSQRCSEGVWKLANSLVDVGERLLPNAFYKIYMNPVEGRNPEEKKPIVSEFYNNGIDEKIKVVNTIKTLFRQNPKSTVGVLLRNNYQVNAWAKYINDSGLNAITRNECLAQKNIFKVIYSILKLVANPFDNELVANAYENMAEAGILKFGKKEYITAFVGSFLAQNNDIIEDKELSKFHWDMNYWLSFTELTIDELALKIGLNYFSGNIEKSNIFLISTLIAKINNGNFKQTLDRLNDLSSKPNLSGFKFFTPEDENQESYGKVQIMTLHKSKGDEFDYVFLPEMSEKNLTLDIKELSLKKSSGFMENVRGLKAGYKKKSEYEQKQDIIGEDFRLLYVAITRAKRRLYISVAKKDKHFGRMQTVVPSIIFDELLGKYPLNS